MSRRGFVWCAPCHNRSSRALAGGRRSQVMAWWCHGDVMMMAWWCQQGSVPPGMSSERFCTLWGTRPLRSAAPPGTPSQEEGLSAPRRSRHNFRLLEYLGVLSICSSGHLIIFSILNFILFELMFHVCVHVPFHIYIHICIHICIYLKIFYIYIHTNVHIHVQIPA